MEVKRLRRIISVRTTQRDISAMQLWAANHRTLAAERELVQAHEELTAASALVPTGAEVRSGDLERMDVARVAALGQIAECQVERQEAEVLREAARSQAHAQQILLEQSEKLGEIALRAQQKKVDAAEQKLSDERSSGAARGTGL